MSSDQGGKIQMEKERKVMTSVGEFLIIRPKAGPRNRAMVKADTGKGLKFTVLSQELLPACIGKVPDSLDNKIPIDQVLNGLEIDDYDLLATAMMELIESSSDKKIAEKEAEEKKT
jgi:hypothetical protein